jgi:hypothetical protein
MAAVTDGAFQREFAAMSRAWPPRVTREGWRHDDNARYDQQP